MNKELNAHGRQEREEILNENLIAAQKKIIALRKYCCEVEMKNLKKQKTINNLKILIVQTFLLILGLIYLVFV